MDSIFWLVLFVGFTVGEAATVGLTCIWFAMGALIALISVALGASTIVQSVVFLSVAGFSMLVFRPTVAKYLKPKREEFNAQSLLGRVALVTQLIDNVTSSGEVQIRGQLWSAESRDGAVVLPETRVRVLEVRGSRLMVGPVEVEYQPVETLEEVKVDDTED